MQSFELDNINGWQDSAKTMEGLAHYSSTQPKVISLSRSCKTIKDIYLAVGSCFVFEPDEGKQTYRTGQRLIEEGVGNCVDATILTSAILINKGIPHTYEYGAMAKNKPVHVWIKVGGFILDTVKGRSKLNPIFNLNTIKNFNTKHNFAYISKHEIKF